MVSPRPCSQWRRMRLPGRGWPFQSGWGKPLIAGGIGGFEARFVERPSLGVQALEKEDETQIGFGRGIIGGDGLGGIERGDRFIVPAHLVEDVADVDDRFDVGGLEGSSSFERIQCLGKAAGLFACDAEVVVREGVVGADGDGGLKRGDGIVESFEVGENGAEVDQRGSVIGAKGGGLLKDGRGPGEIALLAQGGAQIRQGFNGVGTKGDGYAEGFNGVIELTGGDEDGAEVDAEGEIGRRDLDGPPEKVGGLIEVAGLEGEAGREAEQIDAVGFAVEGFEAEEAGLAKVAGPVKAGGVFEELGGGEPGHCGILGGERPESAQRCGGRGDGQSVWFASTRCVRCIVRG